MINLALFLSIAFVGVILTIVIYCTGKKKKIQYSEEPYFNKITFLNISISIIVLIYIFRLFMMFLTGLISDFVVPAIITGIIALIPILAVILSKRIGRNIKV